ncbi:MAG: class II fructose-bisphosphate aldolase [Clostridia bacterium]|nr:class II fructose-bisphosphate aldolase [Clostridia bacterium]
MPYVNAKQMILDAKEGGYAVPAFNAENLEMVQAIIAAAEKEKSPVIVQTTSPTVNYITLPEAVAMVRAMAMRARIPVALHLDHCTSPDDVATAMREGYTSVMFDGSRLPYQENAEISRRVALLAHDYGVSVECEIGALGGKEDGVGGPSAYTDPDEAGRFARYTGADYLAVAIGTSHGFYKGEPKLDYDRLAAIRDSVGIPLVLHGGSGLHDEQVKKCISLGIAKVNIATELRAAATRAVREALRDESIIDPKKFMGPARDAVEALCTEKIRLCGSNGAARLNYVPFD